MVLTVQDKARVRELCRRVIDAPNDTVESYAMRDLAEVLARCGEQRIVIELDGKLLTETLVREIKKQPPLWPA